MKYWWLSLEKLSELRNRFIFHILNCWNVHRVDFCSFIVKGCYSSLALVCRQKFPEQPHRSVRRQPAPCPVRLPPRPAAAAARQRDAAAFPRPTRGRAAVQGRSRRLPPPAGRLRLPAGVRGKDGGTWAQHRALIGRFPVITWSEVSAWRDVVKGSWQRWWNVEEVSLLFNLTEHLNDDSKTSTFKTLFFLLIFTIKDSLLCFLMSWFHLFLGWKFCFVGSKHLCAKIKKVCSS